MCCQLYLVTLLAATGTSLQMSANVMDWCGSGPARETVTLKKKMSPTRMRTPWMRLCRWVNLQSTLSHVDIGKRETNDIQKTCVVCGRMPV